MPPKEPGWGREKKEERVRKLKEDQRIVKEDFNDPFKFKPLKGPSAPSTASAASASSLSSTTGASISAPFRVASGPPALQVPASLSLSGAPVTSVPTSQPPVQQSSPLSADELASSSSSSLTSFSSLSAPPVSMTASMSGSSNTPMNTRLESAVCVHAALVELHEHHGLKKSKPYGPKGAAILKSPLDGGYSLLLYAPITKKHEFELEINPKFSFTVLTSLFATFSDPASKRYWSVQFKSQEDLDQFCKFIALVKDYRSQVEAKSGGSRRVISQDLIIGAAEHRVAVIGDQIKLKCSVYLTSDTHPMGIGRKIASIEPKRFTLGQGASTLPPGIEEGIVGMKKKGSRFLCVPPLLSTDANVWGPHVPPDATLLVEVTILSVRSPDEAKARVARVRAAKVRGPTDNVPPEHPHITDDGDDGDEGETSPASSITLSSPVMSPNTAPPPATPPAQQQPVVQPVAAAVAASTQPIATAPVATPVAAAPAVVGGVASNSPAAAPAASTPTGMNPTMYPAGYAYQPTMMHPGMMPPMMVYPHDMMMAAAAARPSAPISLRDRMRMLAQAGGGTGGVAPTITSSPSPEGYPSVSSLLTELHLSEYIQVFSEEGISFKDLVTLSDSDLKELIPQMGPRRRILARAHELAGQHAAGGSKATVHVHDATASDRGTRIGRTGSAAEHRPVLSAAAAAAAAPSAVTSSSSSTASPPVVGSYTADDLRREYERGQSDTLTACKERIEQIKTTAKTKFGELEAEIAGARKKNTDDIEQAKLIIGKLRGELKATTLRLEAQTIELKTSIDERERMRERSRAYVAQVQERDQKREPTSKIVRACMERVFTQISAAINPKDITDGAQMLEVVKRQIQAVTLSVMAALEKEQAAQQPATAAQ